MSISRMLQVRTKFARQRIVNASLNKLQTLNAKDKIYKQDILDITFNDKPTIYIISAITGGGALKYLLDITKNYINFEFILVKAFSDLCKIKKESIIFLQHLFFIPDIDVDDIISIVKSTNSKLIITIHDWYWLDNNVKKNFDDTISWHNLYLSEQVQINKKVQELFLLSQDIILPSQFAFNIYSKYFNNNNFKIVPHNDYYVYKQDKYIKTITEMRINIGVLHENTICKGSELINYLKMNYQSYKNYQIKWFIVHQNIEKYTNDGEFYKLIDNHNIHALTLLSKYGETWCYALTKYLNSKLPIIYNNFGSFKERIHSTEHYFKAYDNEIDMINDNQTKILRQTFESLLDYIIVNQNYGNKHNFEGDCIIYNNYYNKLFQKKSNINLFAVYFPQFHKFKENDINYYDNYSDLINLLIYFDENKNNPEDLDKPLFLSELDYNLENNHITKKQIDIAKSFNIQGFAIYYYWFSLNTITNKNLIMENGYTNFFKDEISDFKVFFIWANEDWSNNPAFNTMERILNIYDESNFEENANNLIFYFNHPNYHKIDNKPVFFIHHPWFIDDNVINKFYTILNHKCVENGFSGIHFGLNSSRKSYNNFINYDFNPNYKNPSAYLSNNTLDYEKYVDYIDLSPGNISTLFFDFNNTARLYKPNKLNLRTKTINNNEKNILKYMDKINMKYSKETTEVNKILLINAWNEWGEKMHIEPGEQKKFYYLNLLKNLH